MDVGTDILNEYVVDYVIDSRFVFCFFPHQLIKEGIKLMIGLFCGGFGDHPSNNRLALIEFSREATGLYAFNRDQRLSTLRTVIDSLFPMYGYTCTERAFALGEVLFGKLYGKFLCY